MSTPPRIAIQGVGFALGDIIRGNDDPIFDWLRKHPPHGGVIFDGLKYRRVLPCADDVIDIVARSCRDAAADAKVALGDVDLLIGSTSVSGDIAPNGLCRVHHALGLSASCRVLPLNSDYGIFLDGLRIADSMIKSGAARRALVACGNNWTHHVDYHEAVSLAASDAAGAAVVGASDDTTRFTLIDCEEATDTSWLGAFHMSQRGHGKDHPVGYHEARHFTKPLMTVDTDKAPPAIKGFGLPMPPKLIATMLARHGLTSKDITLVAHQTSKSIFDAWNTAIQPAHYVNTLEELGDMVSSSAPVNLAKCYGEIETKYLVLMGIGMEMHATTLLYQRD